MILFKAEVQTKQKRRALEVIVHAESLEDAKAYLAGKFPGCTTSNWIELDYVPKYFIVAELEPEQQKP